MLDASVCNYLHYVWMLYHVGLIQKYVSLKLLQHLHICKALSTEKQKFFFPRIQLMTPEALGIALLAAWVSFCHPPSAQMSSQFHSSTFPSQMHLVFQRGSIPSHPTRTDLKSGIMQLHLNLFRCCVLVSSLFETCYPISSADVNIILSKALSKQLTFLTARNSFQLCSDVIFLPFSSWIFLFHQCPVYLERHPTPAKGSSSKSK